MMHVMRYFFIFLYDNNTIEYKIEWYVNCLKILSYRFNKNKSDFEQYTNDINQSKLYMIVFENCCVIRKH